MLDVELRRPGLWRRSLRHGDDFDWLAVILRIRWQWRSVRGACSERHLRVTKQTKFAVHLPDTKQTRCAVHPS